jgi:hypothetical protein
MPYNGSGVFSILNSFVPNTTITSSAANANNSDIAVGLSNALTRDGQAGMTAALSMGSHLINNVTDPSGAQDAATKNYVDTQNATVWSTGDVKLTLKTVADSGWVMFTDGTIGDASSNATVASAATSALFALLYASPFTDATCPLLTSTGVGTTRGAQGTAAAAYAAHCRISTPAALGRVMALAGTGSGLTARVMGTTTGGESSTLITANLPAYTPAGTFSASLASGSAAGTGQINASALNPGAVQVLTKFGGGTVDGWSLSVTGTVSGSIVGTAQGGTSTAFTNMQPTTFLNAMVKL